MFRQIQSYLPTLRPPPIEIEHEIGLPEEHELTVWLMNNPDGAIKVTAGQTSDVVGGVRFSCPSDGEDCVVKISRDGDKVMATSTGGMAEAIPEPRVPQPPPEPTRTPVSQPTTQQLSTGEALRIPGPDGNPRRRGRFHFTWLHGLQTAPLTVAENGEPEKLSDEESATFSIDDGEFKEYGRVKFSCTGKDCQVYVHRSDTHDFIVAYTGNVTAKILPFDSEKMKGSFAKESYCLNDTPDDCTFPDFVLDNPTILNSYSRTPLTINSKEILFDDLVSTILTEDKKTRVDSNYGWQGKRYVNHSDGTSTFRNNRYEFIIYTNADGPDDTNYLSYGRSMIINSDGDWILGYGYEKSSESMYGLGDLTGKVTYNGGATGGYALTGDLIDETGEKADAGYFTARATFNADLNSDLTSNNNLLIEGTIDKFMDQDGVERDWKIDLQSNNFEDRSKAKISIDTPISRTVWTIGDESADPSQRWGGYAAEEGNSIHGSFFATHGTEGRLRGAFGANRVDVDE